MDKNQDLDIRIEAVWEKIRRLPEKKLYSGGKWPPVWDAPLTEAETAEFERKNGVRLPEDYRRFITTKAAGGSQPFYGLLNPTKPLPSYQCQPVLDKPFPCTLKKPFICADMTQEEQEAYYNSDVCAYDAGYLLLSTEGCGMDSILVINTEDAETYGTVWYYDLANDCGIYPMMNPAGGGALRFLEWLEYWADFMLEHGEEDYFTYAELVALQE